MTHPRGDDSASTYRAAWRGGRTIAVLALAIALAVAAHADRADEQLAAAQVLARDGKTEEAEAQFLDIIKANPGSVPALLAVGEFYEKADRVEEAVEIYAHLLSNVDDANEAAQRDLKRCFYRGRFPREIRLAYLKLAPVKFVGQRIHLSEKFHVGEDATETFAYTTSLMFPASLAKDSAAPWVRLPSSIGDANLMYNRVVYGLIADPGQKVLRTRWMVGYPSSTVLMSSGDYTELAQQITHLLVRGHVYLRRYLGIDRQPEKRPEFEAFLTEDGPTGAERLDDRIFFYDIDTVRTPLELVREAFHELGHLLIPRVGPFKGDDRWANGDLGERLLFQWLAEEAAGAGGNGWPSSQASEILSQLYGLDGQNVARYILLSCRLPINVWMATSPDDFSGDDGLERFAGFCLWANAAHGRSFLAGMLQKPDEPAPSAFVAAYKELVTEIIASGASLRVDAGALNVMGSKLMQPPVEGALRRELIAIGAEGQASFRVYLPAGALSLSVECDRGAEAVLSIHLDGATEFIGNLTGPVELGTVQAGWHEVRVGCASEGPVEIKSLSFFATEPPGE